MSNRVCCDDALAFLRGLDDNSVDLIFCSPPYEDARTYGIDFRIKGQAWVDWCVERWKECDRVCKGLVAWVVEGKTRKFQWSATPALLMADLHRAGIKLRKPPAFKRVGIPGSGGPDWLRNDYEFIVCSSKGKLLWSDNCVMGKPPVYEPGGKPSHRRANGSRVNDGFSFWSLRKLIEDYCCATQNGATEVLQDLQQSIDSKEVSKWVSRIAKGLQRTNCLQSDLLGGIASGEAEEISGRCNGSSGGTKVNRKGELSKVRLTETSARSSSRRKPAKQFNGESGCSVQQLPSEGAQKKISYLSGVWQEKSVQKTLRQALHQVEASWESLDPQDQPILAAYCGRFAGRKVITRNNRGSRDNGVYKPPALANPGNVIECVVGGGVMGSRLCHENEAPFSERLVEFFIRSFCPPDGLVVDPFCGSGTTMAVAERLGRRWMGCDTRQSQVELSMRRIQEVRQ